VSFYFSEISEILPANFKQAMILVLFIKEKNMKIRGRNEIP
jgi:hypothetical protein